MTLLFTEPEEFKWDGILWKIFPPLILKVCQNVLFSIPSNHELFSKTPVKGKNEGNIDFANGIHESFLLKTLTNFLGQLHSGSFLF